MSVLSVVFSVTCPLVISHCDTPMDDHWIWINMNRTSIGQVMDKYRTKKLGTDNEQTTTTVIWWLSILNFEHTQNSPTNTPDINVHVTDKTDMDRWVPDDQWITKYGGICYSSVHSILFSERLYMQVLSSYLHDFVTVKFIKECPLIIHL